MKSAALLLVLLTSNMVLAMQVLPMEAEIDPSKTTTIEFSIKNTDSEDIAAELHVVARTLSPQGEELRTESDDFFVFPRQVVLKKQGVQTIKLNWKGPKAVTQELAYRLVIDQLPVELAKKKAKESENKIDFLYKFVASIYVRPDGAKPSVSVQDFSFEPKKRAIALTISNTGAKHQILTNARLVMAVNEAKKTIPIEEVKSLFNKNVLAGTKLKTTVPWSDNTAPKNVTIEFINP